MPRLLKKHAVEQDVYSLAVERVRTVFDRFDHVAVAFSGGKDSTAVLNVALGVARELDRLPLRVVMWDEEGIPLQTEEYVRRVGQVEGIALEWYCLPIRSDNACTRRSPHWYPWAPEDEEKWVRPLPPEALTQTPFGDFPRDPARIAERPPHHEANGYLFDPGTQGVPCLLMGIRAQESMTRLRATLTRYEENWLHTHEDARIGQLAKAYPIYDWQTEDVWTAPATFGWDYNRAYDRMEMAGISAKSQRISNPFGNEPLQALPTFAATFPEIADRLAYRVPGAATAMRYARTELYSFGKRMEKPAGMPWREWVLHWIGKWPPADQRFIAGLIAGHIRQHFSQTSDPILGRNPHPLTGVSWEFLAMIAVRNDRRRRKQPHRWGDNPAYQEQKAARARAYQAELQRIREAGQEEEIRP